MPSKTQRRTRKQVYSARLKTSNCRGRSATRCRLKDGCKLTKNGRRKSFCRSIKDRSA
jgi:hypothetical protein